MNKQKIAFVIPSLGAGGAERVVTTLANDLINNYEVSIIAYIKVIPFYYLNPNIKIYNCVDSISPSPNIFTALISNYLLFKRISTIIRQKKIELMIGFLTSANVLSVMASKYNSIPCIISERNNPQEAKINKMWKLFRNMVYPKANFIVVQTKEIKEYYASSIKANRLIILPNPISDELTIKRQENSIKENFILNVGRLTNQKSQGVLIRAFSKTENKNWQLVIIGEGPKRLEIEALIKRLDLTKKVILLGKTKNISDYYNKSKIFAFTSIFEGFPNALIEAMHFGLACVSTDCPTGPSELIKNGNNGYLVPMNDENAIAKKLNILMNDNEKCNIFGKQAVKTVEKFEVKNVIKQWDKIINASIN